MQSHWLWLIAGPPTEARCGGPVRRALEAKGVPQASNRPLVAKRLDWTMGNVRLLSWQMFGPLGLVKALPGSMLDIELHGPLGGCTKHRCT